MITNGSTEPKISVILATHNSERFILEALQSVFKQKFKPFEVIIADDHSSDGTIKKVQKTYPEVKIVRSRGHGVSAARNTAIKYASGDYIANLDSDDIWLSNKLLEQAPYLEPKKIVICQAINFEEYQPGSKQSLGKAYPEDKIDAIEDLLVIGKRIPGSSWIIARKSFREVGMLNESLRVGEMYDFFARAMHFGYSFFNVDECLVYRRLHDRNLHAGNYFSGFESHSKRAVAYARYIKVHRVSSKQMTLHSSEIITLVVWKFFYQATLELLQGQSRTKVKRRLYPYMLLVKVMKFAVLTHYFYVGFIKICYSYMTSLNYRKKIKKNNYTSERRTELL